MLSHPARSSRVPFALLAILLLAAVVALADGAGQSVARGDEPASVSTSESATGETSPQTSSAVPAEGAEIISKRTATTDTFALPDGEREMRSYGAPVNYRDAEGGWQPIAEGFKWTGAGIEDRSHPFDIHLPPQMGEGPVRFGGPEHWISFELAGHDSTSAELETGGIVSYEIPASGTSFEYSTLPSGVKETVELAGPSSPDAVHYRLTAAAGITPELSPDGSIDFLEGEGDRVAVMPAPTVSDAGSMLPISGPASYSLARQEDGSWMLSVEVERSWLEDPAREWPVRVDPTLEEVVKEGPAGGTSCILNSFSPEVSSCGGSLMGVLAYSYPEGREQVGRTALAFLPSGIPSTAQITENS